jgi:hypothetical protein
MAKQTDTTLKGSLISSSLIILAGLSTFITKLKQTLHLTSDYIRNSLGKTDSTTKNALCTSIIVMQNRKWAEDALQQIDELLKKIAESEGLAKQLAERKIKLNSPIPNFKSMADVLHKKQLKLADFIKQLNAFGNKQDKLNQEFLTKCDTFKQEVTAIYNKLNIEFSEQKFGKDVSEIIT